MVSRTTIPFHGDIFGALMELKSSKVGITSNDYLSIELDKKDDFEQIDTQYFNAEYKHLSKLFPLVTVYSLFNSLSVGRTCKLFHVIFAQ